MQKIKENITEKELKEMGFSRLAVKFIYSRRGKSFEEIQEEIYQSKVPYMIKQNIIFVMECYKDA